MINSGYHTPKRSENSTNKNNLNTHIPSLKNAIKRRQSFLPVGVLNLCKESNDNSNKKGYSSLKKQIKKGLTIESIPEEIKNNKINKKEKSIKKNSHKNSKFKEYQNNYFINMIKNVYTNENHYFKLLTLSSNKINNQEFHEKDKLVPSTNHKLSHNISHYLDKNNLSKKEKKSKIHHSEKNKEISATQKHKLVHSKTQKYKKKKKRISYNEELQIQNKNTENEIKERNKNNSIIKDNIILQQTEKINCFKAFLCCLKSN